VALLDIKLPGISGIDLLQMIKKNYQTTAIVMISGIRDIDIVIESMKLGALDYIVKPFTVDKLISSMGTVLKSSQRCNSVSSAVRPMEIISHGAKTDNQSLNKIDAIAYGVDAQVDYFDFHSKIVTERAVDLARQFGLPDRDIDEWAESRREFYSKRDGYIRSISSKLERNPLVQVMLGIAKPVFKFPRSSGEQN
jgi:YesN/AraC family two-component response regulator